MNRSRLRRLPGLPRTLYRRSSTRRAARQEKRFSARLQSDPHAPALLLSPHWDDAVLDCWGLLASARELNVLNVFAGVPPPGRRTRWEAIIGARDSAERALRRIAEDALALERAGRRAHNLSLLEVKHRPARAAIGLEELDRAVAGEVQSASRVYVPAGIGGHVDHLLIRRYGRALLRGGMPVTLYAELPYCVFHGWPSWVDGRPADPNRDVDRYWASFLDGLPEMPPLRSAEVQRLDGPAAESKAEAIRSYETSLNYGVRRLLSDPEISGFEVRWELVRRDAEAIPPVADGDVSAGTISAR
jgi:hypothetical protein